ncbi:MAG: hypothetical protein R3Y30_16265 [Vibrio sp.]
MHHSLYTSQVKQLCHKPLLKCIHTRSNSATTAFARHLDAKPIDTGAIAGKGVVNYAD